MLHRTGHQAVLKVVVDVISVGTCHITAQANRSVTLTDFACEGAVCKEAIVSLGNFLYCTDEAGRAPCSGCIVLVFFSHGTAETTVTDVKGTFIRDSADEARTISRFTGITPDGSAVFASGNSKFSLVLNYKTTQRVRVGTDVGTHLHVLDGGGTVHRVNHAGYTCVSLYGTCDYKILNNGSFAGAVD